MDSERLKFLYGTDQPPIPARRLRAGPLSVLVGAGGLQEVRFGSVEILRGLDFPVRDANWGTLPARTGAEEINETDGAFSIVREFSVAPALTGIFRCEGTADGVLTADLTLTADAPVEVNRAGFVLLHPTACAGAALRIGHSDGTTEATRFPLNISPSQPASDIRQMHLSQQGVDVAITFAGETFEMEDQRNWTDASYKTYCRPLSLPWPYEIAAGSRITQTVTIAVARAGEVDAGAGRAALQLSPSRHRVPEVALAMEQGWHRFAAGAEPPKAGSTLLRLDLRTEAWRADLADLLAAVVGALDLELVLPDRNAALDSALRGFAAELKERRCAPRSVTGLPSAWLKSYQPDADWPEGPSPEGIVGLVRQIFPDSETGCGMLTNFTELNRHPAAARAGDFVTCSTTAIVHAAEDAAVMQTLEALPQVYRSLADIAPGVPCRLGLASIGMRTNPYGSDIVANPDRIRIPMAREDPRQSGLFAAAFMTGVMAATQGSVVERIALAAPSGPFGLGDGDRLHPVSVVYDWLCAASGRARLDVNPPADLAAVAYAGDAGTELLVANLTAAETDVALPHPAGFRILGAAADLTGGRLTAPRQSGDGFRLDAWGIAFVSFGKVG